MSTSRRIILIGISFFLIIMHSYSQNFTLLNYGAIYSTIKSSKFAQWGDFNNDGFDDVVIDAVFYKNNADGTFTNFICCNFASGYKSAVGDYNNDGLLDLAVAVGTGVKIYKNNGGFNFEVTFSNSNYTNCCSFVDYNNDGYLDLLGSSNSGICILYRNMGDGTFVENTSFNGSSYNNSYFSSWADIDSDGDLDLMINAPSNNNILRNDGNEIFTDLQQPNLFAPYNFSIWSDINNDGLIDLCAGGGVSSTCSILINQGNFTFNNIQTTNVEAANFGAFGDWNKDGLMDLYIMAGSSSYSFGDYDQISYNLGNGNLNWIPQSGSGFINKLDFSSGGGWSDYDKDGDLDLIVSNRQSLLVNGTYYERDHLYINNINSLNWINIKCTGKISNKSAIGTKIKIKANIKGIPLWQYHEINGNPESNLSQFFGLDTTNVVDSIIVSWPSGCKDTLLNISSNQFLTIEESCGCLPPTGINDTVCNGMSTTLRATGGLNYHWYTNSYGGTPISSTDSLVTPILNSQTTYYVSSYNSSYESIRVPIKVFVTDLRVDSFTIVHNVCQQDSTGKINLFIDGGNLPYNTFWSNSITDTNSIDSLQTGEYFLTVTNNYGCLNTDSFQIMGNLLNANFDFSITTPEVAFNNLSLYQNSVLWDFGDGYFSTLNSPVHYYNNVDTFTVKLIAFAQNCSDTLSSDLEIKIFLRAPIVIDPILPGDTIPHESQSYGVSFLDNNNDSLLDMAFTTENINVPFILNSGNSIFNSWNSIVAGSDRTNSITCGDFNNDGFDDAFIGINDYIIDGGSYILINDSNGFSDGNFQYIPIDIAKGSSWVDFDLDGDLDLHVLGQNYPYSSLFVNQGNGAFNLSSTIIPSSTSSYMSNSCLWADYNNDGYQDVLFTALYSNYNNLFKNNGNNSFTPITISGLTNISGHYPGASWGDYNNDGFLDLFVTAYNGQSKLYKNIAGNNFNLQSGLISPIGNSSSGSSWVDFNNDGYLDLYVTNYLEDNFLYINNGNETFTPYNMCFSLHDSLSYGCAWGDINNDGFLDLVLPRAAFIGQSHSNLLFVNSGNNNNWINIKLVGNQANKSAIGAKIKIYATINGSPRMQVSEITSTSGAYSQNSLNVEFGLGNATLIDSLVIIWPSISGANKTLMNHIEVYYAVGINQFITITEQFISESNTQTFTDLNFSIYPNPTKNKITISTNQEKYLNCKISIYSMAGIQVYSGEIYGNNSANIDLTTLCSGIYFIELKNDSFNKRIKLVKY